MLPYLRHKRAPISRLLLILLGVLWLGLAAQTCAMGALQPDAAQDCCCEHGKVGFDLGYVHFEEGPCPAMQAVSADCQHQVSVTAERPPAVLAPLFSRVVHRPVDTGIATPRPAQGDAPYDHPALRFRVLLI